MNPTADFESYELKFLFNFHLLCPGKNRKPLNTVKHLPSTLSCSPGACMHIFLSLTDMCLFLFPDIKAEEKQQAAAAAATSPIIPSSSPPLFIMHEPSRPHVGGIPHPSILYASHLRSKGHKSLVFPRVCFKKTPTVVFSKLTSVVLKTDERPPKSLEAQRMFTSVQSSWCLAKHPSIVL